MPFLSVASDLPFSPSAWLGASTLVRTEAIIVVGASLATQQRGLAYVTAVGAKGEARARTIAPHLSELGHMAAFTCRCKSG